MVINCVRYLNMTDINAINSLSFYDYSLLFEGIKRRLEDEDFIMYKQSWLNRIVSATNKKSEFIYRKFDDFYKKKKEVKVDRRALELLKIANRGGV